MPSAQSHPFPWLGQLSAAPLHAIHAHESLIHVALHVLGLPLLARVSGTMAADQGEGISLRAEFTCNSLNLHESDLGEAMTHPLDPRVARFPFEGRMLTVRQVHNLVPALSIPTIRRLLKEGRTDRFQMLNEDPSCRRKLSGKAAKERYVAFTFGLSLRRVPSKP